MTDANSQPDAQSKQTKVEPSPKKMDDDRKIQIKAAMEHAVECIVTHMRNQILSGKNGL